MVYPYEVIRALEILESAATHFGMAVLTFDDEAPANAKLRPAFKKLLSALKTTRLILGPAKDSPPENIVSAAKWAVHTLQELIDQGQADPDMQETLAKYAQIVDNHLTNSPHSDTIQALAWTVEQLERFGLQHWTDTLQEGVAFAREQLLIAQNSPTDDLLDAARRTLALWDKHGLGDDHEESDPIYEQLKRAVRCRTE